MTVEYSELGAVEDHQIESTLALYYLDTETNQWVKDANSRVDTLNHLITTHTTHMGDWLVLCTSWSSQVYLPLAIK